MIPTTYDLDSVLVNDTWAGIESLTITVDGIPPASAAASARMRFARDRVHGHDNVQLNLSSEGGDITITDADDWIFSVLPRTPIGLEPGNYLYSFQTTDAAGTKQTYLEGQITVIAKI